MDVYCLKLRRYGCRHPLRRQRLPVKTREPGMCLDLHRVGGQLQLMSGEGGGALLMISCSDEQGISPVGIWVRAEEGEHLGEVLPDRGVRREPYES